VVAVVRTVLIVRESGTTVIHERFGVFLFVSLRVLVLTNARKSCSGTIKDRFQVPSGEVVAVFRTVLIVHDFFTAVAFMRKDHVTSDHMKNGSRSGIVCREGGEEVWRCE